VVLAVALLLVETPSPTAPAGATAGWCVMVEPAPAVTTPLMLKVRVLLPAVAGVAGTLQVSRLPLIEQPEGRPVLETVRPVGMG
jgi:hypothetical protein